MGKHCLRLLEKIEFVLAAMVAVMRKMSIPPGVGSESRKAEREKAIEEVQEDLQAPPSGALVVRPVDATTLKASMIEAGENATIKSSAARFSAIMRESFPGSFSPKVELIVNHLSEQVEKWGTIGWFSAQRPECAP